MEQNSKPYVFVSYAHLDNDTVMPLIKGLQQRGIHLWYDDGIEPATEWEEYIGERVAHCSCLLVFLSQNTVESENCRDELSLAKRYRKKVLVVYLKPEKQIKLSYYWEYTITSKQAMFMDRSPNPEKFLDKLAGARIMKPCRTVEVAPAEAPAKESPATPEEQPAASAGEMLEIVEPVRENDPTALLQLAMACDEDARQTDDWDKAEALQRKAADYYLKAAEAGNADAMYQFALCCYRGKGVEPDYRLACSWAMDAKYREHPEATFLLATFYAKGIGTEKSPLLAAHSFLDAAYIGHVEACVRLADCYLAGEGMEQDTEQALRWYTEGARRGSGEGMVRAADLYAREQKALDAFTWYQRAAAKNQMARYKLAMCHLTGFGTPEDKGNAFRLLKGLADFATPDIMPDASLQLALFLERQGDRIEAARYYHRAAALGCPEAYDILRNTKSYRSGPVKALRFAVTQSRYRAEEGSYQRILLPWLE